MNKAAWQWPLEAGETLLWEGRPAPRCYTFRNWKLALAGTALFLATSFWMMLGYQLVESEGHSFALVAMTLPLVLATFMMGPGHLIVSRWRWNNLFYALTDRRLLLRGGLFKAKIRSYPRAQISGWQQKRFAEQLASIRVLRGDEAPLIFACLEYPQNLTEHLPKQRDAADTRESV